MNEGECRASQLVAGRPSVFRSAFIVSVSPGTAAEENEQLDEAVHEQAEPEVDHSPQIELETLVPRPRRQMRSHGKVEGLAENNGHQVLDPA